ncbi:MAG: efflux RND transporter permease subunit [Lachnospiraceae bacterium]|nr:efflux RND transporter permease subunit [Candidatus Colinaster scatohippi]
MSKLSVKKPFTILVCVIAVIVLGFVSLFKLQLDLLPNISLPYLLVITTYPGASSEKVEEEVVKPMEGALGTINGVKNVYGVCNENYGMIQLEFQDDTNLDSAMVKVSSALNTLQAVLPEECGNPSIMELGTDMMASMYLAVSMEGMSIEETSKFVEDNITPTFARLDGVASVSEMGLVEKSVQIELNQNKINVVNDKVLASLDGTFADAVEQLDNAKKQLEDSADTIAENKQKLLDSQQDLLDGAQDLIDGQKELDDNKYKLATSEAELDENIEKMEEGQKQLKEAKEESFRLLVASSRQMEQSLTEYNKKLSDARAQLKILEDNLNKAKAEYEANPDDPEKQTNYFTALAIYEEAAQGINRLQSGISQLEEAYKEIEKQKLDAAATLGSTDAQLAIGKAQLESGKAQLDASRKQLDTAQEQLDDGWDSLKDAQKQIDDGWDSLKDGEKQLADGWDDYYDAVKNYEKQRIEATKKANINDLVKLETLAGIIYAQNFEMPAGYVDDKDDNSWLIKVGQNIDSIDELNNTVLCNIHNVGDIKLSDVADVTIIDNSLDSYVRLGAEPGVILSIFKSSIAGTNDVSKVVEKNMAELKEKYPGINIMVMMDQGDYINMIVKSVLQSMAIGALLAIIILAIFLKDVKPTLVVAISIPLSVLLALVAMYFSNISLNMLSLSGLALGIGMLVDNSIVVIENIYRLRGRGVEAPRAAVQGTKQVAGAIISSTLTTACVFLPMIYTTGLVKELMMPMCLTIVYCLLASLIIAMTVAPAAASTVLRKATTKEHPLFDKIQDLYGVALKFCLRVKVVPILAALGLLVFSGLLVVKMGIVMIPDMTMTQIEASITYPEEYDREKCYELTDKAIDRLLTVEGISSMGMMAGGDTTLIAGNVTGGSVNFRSMSLMALTENEDAGAEEIKKIMSDMEAAVADLNIDFVVSTASGEMDSLMGGSGLSINIYGQDLDELLRISNDVMDIVATIDGYTDISNGTEEADQVIQLTIDKNKAMSMGLSVAQIYQEIADKIDNDADSVTLNIDNMDMKVIILDNNNPIREENVLDYTFTISEYDEDDDQVTAEHKLSEFATVEIRDGVSTVNRKNQSRYMTVSAGVKEGANVTLLTRELEPLLEAYDMPSGYRYELGGEYDTVIEMVKQMLLVILLGLLFIYLVMVAQFQSLLSPFIVLFTIPLAFTGGFLILWMTGENLSALSMMGFVVLMGTVVNNGIVFVDYTNQLRMGGMKRWDALIATGKTRMRPILMTALTTILAESNLIFGDDMGTQLGRGMALVIAGGLAYATLMTLFIIPVMYDILFKKQPLDVDLGSENLDDVLDDAEEYMMQLGLERVSVEDNKKAKNNKRKKKQVVKPSGKPRKVSKDDKLAETTDGKTENASEEKDD